MLLHQKTVFVAACVAFLLSSVNGAHSYSQLSSHGRRTQAVRYSLAKRQGSFKDLGSDLDGIVQGTSLTLGDVLGGIVNEPPDKGDNNPSNDGTQSEQSSLVPASGSSDAVSSPSATPTSPGTSASSAETSNSPSTGGSPARDPMESHPASTSTQSGLLAGVGGVIDTLTHAVAGGNDHPTAVPSESPIPTEHAHEPTPTTAFLDPSSTVLSTTSTNPSSPDPSPAPSSSATSGGGGGGILNPVTSLLGPVLGSPSSAQDSTISQPSTSASNSNAQSQPTTSPTPTTSQGGILDPVTSILGPVLGSPAESSSAQESSTTPLSASGTDSPAQPQSTTSPASSSQGGILNPVTSILGPVLGPPASSAQVSNTNPPSTFVSDSNTQSQPTTTSALTTSQGGILDPVTSILGPVLSPPAESSSVPGSSPEPRPTSTPTSIPPASATSSQGGILDPINTIISTILGSPGTSVSSSNTEPNPTPSPSPSAPSSSSQGGILTSIISTILGPQPYPTTTNSDPTALPSTSFPSITPTVPVPGNDTASPSNSDVPQQTISLSLSESISGSATPTISFPSATTSFSNSVTEATGTRDGISTSATTTLSIQSDLSFVLTAPTLAFASMPSSSSIQTLTDPDQPTTTFEAVSTSATTIVMPAALPTGMPARIFPREQLDPNIDLSGFTLISILFNNELNWRFVVANPLASSQIFAYLPVLLTTALNITSGQFKTYALQVYIPSSYRGPADADELGTMWLGYIPSDLVDTLAAQIKVKSSPFYTGVPDGVPRDLANRVNSGFPLLSVADPNQEPGSVGSGGQNGSSNSDDGKSRRDAIIGVVSALGAIALFVLIFLVYRSMKRRRQLAHRRLSDPPDGAIGVRPTGRQFDQDSVGGARRRSFYFAEDSLRGFEQQEEQTMAETSTSNNLTQRRNVIPGSISAPVLKGSTLNW